MNDIKLASYNELIKYLNDTEKKSNKEINFLITNKITFCVNNKNSIENEIKKNDDFLVLENDNKILYIDNIIINNLMSSIELAIHNYIKENDGHFNKIKKFTLDETVKEIVSLGQNNIKIKSVHHVKDIVNILNKLYSHTSSSPLLNEIISSNSDEFNLILSKKNILTKLMNNNEIVSIKKIDDTIKSVSNKINIFPNSVFPLNKKISLLTLSNNIDFNNECKKNKNAERSHSSEVFNFNKIKNENDDVILKRFEEKKEKLEKYISIYEEAYEIINKIQDGLYFSELLCCSDNYFENVNEIKNDRDFLISNLVKENTDANGVKESGKIGEIKLDNIPVWNLAKIEYKNVAEKLNEYKIGANNLNSNELIDLNNKLEQNILLIQNDLDKIEPRKNRLVGAYENFNYHINNVRLNNNITLLIRDKDQLKEEINKLSDIIYSKISYRKKSFLFSVYKYFFPSKCSKIIKDLEESKKIIDKAMWYLYMLDCYFEINKKDNLRVVGDDFFIKNAVNLISELSLTTDVFDHFNNINFNAKNILNSIFSLK